MLICPSVALGLIQDQFVILGMYVAPHPSHVKMSQALPHKTKQGVLNHMTNNEMTLTMSVKNWSKQWKELIP